MYRSLAKLPVLVALALMGALSAHAAPGDVEFVLERKIPAPGVTGINYISQGSGGEIILCGTAGGAWVSVLARNGDPKFSAVVDVLRDGAHEACWTVLAHDASKTLIAGETNSHSLVGKDWGQESLPKPRRYETTPRAALLASVLPNGSTADKRVLGNLKKYYRNGFYRGLRVADGYVLLGMLSSEWPAFTPSGTQGVPAIWVVKIDFAGNLSWQYRLAEDGNDLLEANPHRHLSQLLELPDGSIVFAAGVLRLAHAQQAGERRLLGRLELNAQNPGGVLMVKLAPDGKELRRVWSRADVHLALRDTEIVSVGNPPRPDPTATVTDRLETVAFDYDLNRKSSSVIEFAPQIFLVEDIATAATGELFAIGIYAARPPGERHRELALVQITEKRLRVLRRFGDAQFGGIARSRDADEFVVARLGSTPWGSTGVDRDLELTRFRVVR